MIGFLKVIPISNNNNYDISVWEYKTIVEENKPTKLIEVKVNKDPKVWAFENKHWQIYNWLLRLEQ